MSMNDNNPDNQSENVHDVGPGKPTTPAKKKRGQSKVGKFISDMVATAAASIEAINPTMPAQTPTEGGADATTGATTPAVEGAEIPADEATKFGGWKRDPDEPLRPHSFHPRVELITTRVPRVLITPQAYKAMCLYVEIASKEVGWMGSVSRKPNGDFLIEETFLLEQEVHETETELAAEDLGRLCETLLDSGEDGVEKVNKLRFWGHSHVHMGTSPSGTDERTMDRFGREGSPWYVRGIFNKFGRAEFTLYLFDKGVRINDAPWLVWDADKNIPLMQDRRRFGNFTGLFSGAGAALGQPVSLIPTELEAEDELRTSIEAEFKLKVKERRRFWGWSSYKANTVESEPNGGASAEATTASAAGAAKDSVSTGSAETIATPVVEPNKGAKE